MRRLFYIDLCTCALLVLFVNSASGQENSAFSRAHIGFGSTVRDADVVQLLDQHAVSAKAGFIWSTGLSGSHRVHESLSAREFVLQARAKTIEFMKDSIGGNDRRLKDFLGAHTEEAVNEEEGLQQQARGLLNIRKQLEGALSAAESGRPILFGIEVEGTLTNLERLRTAPAVKVFSDAADPSSADFRREARSSVNAVKPAAYKAEYRDPIVLTVSPEDLYPLIEEIVSAQTRG